jgi:hypothetical protein
MKRLILAGALTVVALCGYFGVQYYMRAYDPLLAGIPPRENADGTIDYTLIGKDYSKTYSPEQQPDNVEWVIRLPKGSVAHDYGAEDMSVSGGGAGFSHKGKPNLGYYVWLRVTDLKPTISLKYKNGMPEDPDGFSILLDAEKLFPDSQDKASAYGDSECAVSDNPFPRLQAVQQMKYHPNHSCSFVVDDSKKLELFKWSDADPNLLEAKVDCIEKLNFCHFDLYHRGRSLNGKIARAHLSRFAELTPKLHAFLDSATVVDREYKGTPFVYGENK